MKMKAVKGLALCVLILAGALFAGTTPASARMSNGASALPSTSTPFPWECYYGFCYKAYDMGGGRWIDLKVNPGNNSNMCIKVYSWNAGTPTLLAKSFYLRPNYDNYVMMTRYSVYSDATIHAYACNTGAKIFTFKVGALWYPNSFI